MNGPTSIIQHQPADLLFADLPASRQYHVVAFRHWLAGRHWLTVDLAEFRDYLSGQYRPATVNKYLEAVYKAYERLTHSNDVRDQLYTLYAALPEDGCRGLSSKEFVDETMQRILNNANPTRLRVKETTIRHRADSDTARLSYDEIISAIQSVPAGHAARRDRAVIALLAATGLRIAEARDLTIPDMQDAMEGHPALVVRQGKGQVQRVVLYLDEVESLMGYVDEYRDYYGLHTGYLFRPLRSRHSDRLSSSRMSKRQLQRVVETAPTPRPIRVHGLRRSYARMLAVEFGYPEEFIQQQLGHQSRRTTELYIGSRDDIRLKVLAQRAGDS